MAAILNILCICISLVFCGSKLQQNCLYTKTRFACLLQDRFQGKQLTIRAFLLSYNSTSGSRWRPFWNTLLTQLTSNFRSGTISDIHQHVKNYLSTKFCAFNRKWTIPAHIRPTIVILPWTVIRKLLRSSMTPFLNWNFHHQPPI